MWSRVEQYAARFALLVATAVVGCSSPKPAAHTASAPRQIRELKAVAPPLTKIPRYEQGSFPEIKITATGWRELDTQGLQAAREVSLRIDGPESGQISGFLAIPEDRACSSERKCTYYSSPFGTQTIELGRQIKVGRYSVTATSPVGVKFVLEPSSFEIVPGPEARVANLPRESLDYDQFSGSGAVVSTPTGLVVANFGGDALYIDGPTKRRAHKIEGGDAVIAMSNDGIAVAYTAPDDEPRLSLFDSDLTRETPVILGPKRSSHRSWWGEASVQVSWEPIHSAWFAAWLSSEALTKAEAAKFVKRGEMPPRRVRVARLGRISQAGQVHPPEKIMQAEAISNLVWNGKEHAIMIASKLYSRDLRKATWRMTLVQIRRGRVVRKTHFDHEPRCDQLVEQSLHLAWDGKSYIAAIRDHRGLLGSLPETTRLSLVRFGKKAPPVELIVDARKELSSVQLGFMNNQLWLVYASTEKENLRAQVVATLIGRDLQAEKVIVLDDGYDSVRNVALYAAGGALSTAIFRDDGASVVVLPPPGELSKLPEVQGASLYKETACLPDPRLEKMRVVTRSRRPRSFRLRLQVEGGRSKFEVRKHFAKHRSASCLKISYENVPALIKADFVVGPKGQVLGASVRGESLSEDLNRCLLRSLKKTRYPTKKAVFTRVHLEWSR